MMISLCCLRRAAARFALLLSAVAAVLFCTLLPAHAQAAPLSLEGTMVGFPLEGALRQHLLFYMEKGVLYMTLVHEEELHGKALWEAPRFRASAEKIDHRGWGWKSCEAVSYEAAGDTMLLRIAYRPRHEYHICFSAALRQEDGYDEWVSSDAPAVLTLKPGSGKVREAVVKGVHTSPDMSAPPDRLTTATVVLPGGSAAAAPEPAPAAALSVENCCLKMSGSALRKYATGSSGMMEAVANRFADHARWPWQEDGSLDFDAITFSAGRWSADSFSGTYTQEKVGEHALFLNLNVLEEGEVVDGMSMLLEFVPGSSSGKLVWGWEHSFTGNVSFVLEKQAASAAAAPAAQSPFVRLCRQAAEADSLALWQEMKALAARRPAALSAEQRSLFDQAYFCARPFRDASSRHYALRLRPLLAGILAGGGVQERSVSGNTALHYAAAMGSRRLTMWLVQHGADINARNDDGQTPLDCLGVNKSGLDKWMMARGAVRSHELRAGDAVLMEYGSTRYSPAPR